MRRLQPLPLCLSGDGLHHHGRGTDRQEADHLAGTPQQSDAGDCQIADSPAAIDMRDLSLTFETADAPVVALSKVNLQVRAGEFVSLIGPSGCGKTTLMRVMADLVRPTGGQITVNGMSPEQARLARAYGYVFQAPALYAWRTVRRNLMLPLEIMGVAKAEREKRAAQYLAMVGLQEFANKFPWQLSGGMQQRVSIAR